MSGGIAVTVTLPVDELQALVRTEVDRAMRDRDEDRRDRWLDVEDAAEYLACLPRRIYDLKARGRLEYRKDGTRLLFRREWLDAALEQED